MSDNRSSSLIRRPETEVIAEYIDEGASYIHIAGEPGIGKTAILRQITADFEDQYAVNIRNIRPNHSLDDLFREVYHAVYNHLPDELTEPGQGITKVRGQRLTGVDTPIGGISWDADEPEATYTHFGHRDALIGLSEQFPEDQSLLICVDDVHELGDDDRAIRGAIEDMADALPPNIVLITAGRLAFRNLDTAVSLDTLTEEQTALLLRSAFPDIAEDTIQNLHDQVEGHPLYLGLLIESNDDSTSLKLPEHEVYTEIEERYLRFLSSDERRLLRATAPIRELNEAVCTHVLPDSYDLDRVAVAEILESLSTRTVVQTIGRNHQGLPVFKVHDVFRDFLEERWDQTKETEQKAFQYYAETTITLLDEDWTLETEVSHVTSCLEFLSDPVIQTHDQTLSDLVEHVVADGGLSFYPASLLVTELKTRATDQLPDPVVETVLDSVEDRQKIANDFYDTQLHISWTERQFDQGAFDTPSGVLLSYLGRVTNSHPDFVRRAIEHTTADDERKQQYLISIGTDLPADDATVVGEKAVQWIQDTDAYHELADQGLELITHLCANNEFDTALDLLDSILTPREPASDDQLEGHQGMTRYRLIQTLDETFKDLLSERDTTFINVLRTNLTAALHAEAEEGDNQDVIVRHSAVTDLNYAEKNRGKLKHLLLEYFTCAVMQWVGDGPGGAERREFVDDLLKGPITFRRVGFALLAAYPESYRDSIETELLDTDNYRDLPIGYEFHRVLAAGFEHLDEGTQEQICEVINDGPYENHEHRAEQIADREDEPASYFEQRIKETWRRDRLFLIQDDLPALYANQLTELLEKYGEPDQLPTESYRTETTGGIVNQRGPEQINKLRDQPVADVLTTAVEWEPPETERWEDSGSGRLEEWSHIGFSQQLQELIKEQPERYAREISILEDANIRYAEAAFRAFRELLDDGQTFPWDSIIKLGEAVTDEPMAWSSRCRTNLAMLLNKGMAAEETDFPRNHSDAVREILLVLLDDSDPDLERDQPAEGMAGHGDPVQVAINSVRPVALNAFITYICRTTRKADDDPEPELLDIIEDRIKADQSLAVRTVIGRLLKPLWALDQDRIEHRLEDIFPSGDTTRERRRFIAAWNSFVRNNVLWEQYDVLRPYYLHAIQLLAGNDDVYELDVKPTAAHILSSYLFGDEPLSDEESLIRQFYNVASFDDATKLAIALANGIGSPDVEGQWGAIRMLWDWRLDQLENASKTTQENHADEIRQFLDCVRDSSVSGISREQERIRQSLPLVISGSHHWRRIEDWIADQSDAHPNTTVALYNIMVNAAADEEWSSTARTSSETNRERIYENAASDSDEALQTARKIANQFAAERSEMDREFLDTHI